MLCVMNCKKINKCIGNQQCNRHLYFPGQHYSFQWFFQTFPYLWSFSRLFKALKVSTLNSRTFHTFPGSVQTLYVLLLQFSHLNTSHPRATINQSTERQHHSVPTRLSSEQPLLVPATNKNIRVKYVAFYIPPDTWQIISETDKSFQQACRALVLCGTLTPTPGL